MRSLEPATVQTVQVERSGIEAVDQLGEEWRQLCGRSEWDEPFYRPEWIAAYLRAFVPDGKLLLLTARLEERLTGVLPLLEESKLFYGIPVKMLRAPANVHSCRFDLVRAAGSGGTGAVEQIWEAVAAIPDWDVIEFPYMPRTGAASEFLNAARASGFLVGLYDSHQTPIITGLRGTDAIPRKPHLRQNLRRRRRIAEQTGALRLRHCTSANPVEMERFYQLEASGWKGKAGTAILSSPRTLRFYSEIAQAGSRFGYLSLYLLECGERLLAAHFGLQYRDRYYAPKVAYDEQLARLGPGQLIVDAILEDIRSQGFVEFDFLGPWMEWKGEWTDVLRPHAFGYVFRPGVRGRMLYWLRLCAMPRLRRWVNHPRLARLRKARSL